MYQYNIQIGMGHIGRDGNLKLGAAIDLLQNGSWFQMDTEKGLGEYFAKTDTGVYIASRQVDINRFPRYGEKVNIKVWISSCEKIWGHRSTVMYDDQGEVCMASSSLGVFVDLKSGRPTRIPPAVIDHIKLEPPFAMELMPRKIEVTGAAVQMEGIKVQKYHLDSYGHVNNARYIDMAESCLPEDFSVRRIRVEYKNPALLNEMVWPRVYKQDGKIIVSLDRTDGAAYAVVEAVE